MMYVLDPEGKEMLTYRGRQVMMHWEKAYKEACIDAIEPFGDVLEVSFGFGFSASHIQTYFPKTHTIIEQHDQVVRRAQDWAAPYTNVKIIKDNWQNAMDKLGVFDAIYFDDYLSEPIADVQVKQEDLVNSIDLLKDGEFLLSSIKTIVPDLYQKRYNEEDLLSLFEDKGHQDPISFFRFLDELQARAQIHREQKLNVLLHLLQRGAISEKLLVSFKQKTFRPFEFSREGGVLFSFLEKCLTDHMRKGSRFSCFINDPVSKYQDKFWFDKIIANPFLDYKERRIPVDVPKYCEYYAVKEALVVTITKK